MQSLLRLAKVVPSNFEMLNSPFARPGAEAAPDRGEGPTTGGLETRRPVSELPAEPWRQGDGYPSIPEGEGGPSQPVAAGLAGAASSERDDGGAGQPDGADRMGGAGIRQAVRRQSCACPGVGRRGIGNLVPDSGDQPDRGEPLPTQVA